MANRFRTLLAVGAITALSLAPAADAATSAAASASGASAGPVTLKETGSTLLYPLLRSWAAAYHQRTPGVTITTAETGSGAGIAGASDGTADLGASDAFLSAGNLVLDPHLLNIPLAVAAQQVNYNVPGFNGANLRLDGQVLAQMYSGQVTSWRDPVIQRLNPGLSLPNLRVVPLHRQEPSGDTFLFSSYLSTGAPAWNAKIGYGTTIAWPQVASAKAESGNQGMVDACHVTPGCVAYIGISYLSQATSDHLGLAALRNAAGSFKLPTQATMRAAVATFVPATPANETISMVNGPAPDGYPIVNYEYAIVSDHQPSAARARALRAFLRWAITAGNAQSFLGAVRFEALPPAVVTLADAQIARIR